MPTLRQNHVLLGRICFGVMLAGVLTLVAGCPSDRSTDSAGPTTAAEEGNANDSDSPASDSPDEEPKPKPLLADWEAPAVAIVLTGEQHGHLEPCGCSERQSGGLSRRADFVRQLRDRGWPVTGFDLGGLLKRTRRQSEMKFEVTRDALNTIGYQGLGLGPEDLRLGAEFLFTSFSNTSNESGFDLPFIASNVTIFQTREIGTPLTHRVVEVDGVKIGVTAVLSETYRTELFPDGESPDSSLLQIDDPADVLPGVITQLKDEGSDVMLLLAYAKPDESRSLAEAYPDFDLVVTAGGPEDPVGDTEPVGDSLLLRVGTNGKNVAVVGYYPDATEGDKYRFEVVELDRFRFGHSTEIDDRMRAYQQLLESENLVANEPAITPDRGAEYSFIGSEKCADCHDSEYEVWEESHHHQYGFKSLTVAFAQTSDDPSLVERVRMDRIFDPECICCHTAGWDPQEVVRFESGFVGAEESAHLTGVHCENCHGPASKHVELEESGDTDEVALQAEREKMHVSVETAEVQVCHKCHDHENSPDFEFDKYWEQIAH
ncbi:MAG: hypothetical protein KDA93_08130 [Planctomycetaceae bacterium]|nr:hypothetical protein [Planctomycetaceae bacterium]